MKESLFRKKSLERIKSPESLDDYIRVANPGIWLLLVAIVLILAGACVWGTFGHIDSIVNTTVHVQNGDAICTVSEQDITSVKPGMTVQFETYTGEVTNLELNSGRRYTCVLQTEQEIPEGVYDGKIVIQTIKPLFFIIN